MTHQPPSQLPEVWFILPLKPEEETAAREELRQACKDFSNFKLVLWLNPDRPLRDDDPSRRASATDSARQLLTSTMEAEGHAFTAITSVELQELQLDTLLPPWLTSTCPNMTHLCFRRCSFKLPAPTASSLLPHPQLKHLEVDSSGSFDMDQPELLKWQHQLGALTGLNSLSIHNMGNTKLLLDSCSVIGPQLTRLSHTLQAAQLREPRQLVRCFPHVCDLQLLNYTVNDGGLEALLSLRSLRKLQCQGFQLQHNYTRRPCPWTHLGFTELDVASMDRQGVQFTRPVHKVIASPVLAVNERVAAAAVRCGVQWKGDLGGPVTLCNKQAADAACLAALMPMLSTDHDAKFHMSHAKPVTTELLDAMKQHLPRAGVKEVCFDSITCTPEAWRLLLPSMPAAVDKVVLTWDEGEVREAQVIEMCVHAHQSFVVVIREGCTDKWKKGWEGRV